MPRTSRLLRDSTFGTAPAASESAIDLSRHPPQPLKHMFGAVQVERNFERHVVPIERAGKRFTNRCDVKCVPNQRGRISDGSLNTRANLRVLAPLIDIAGRANPWLH